MKKALIIVMLCFASTSQAIVVDSHTAKIVKVEETDGLLYFSICSYVADIISACRKLNAGNGLTADDFQPLLNTLQKKGDRAAVSRARMAALKYILLTTTAISALILTYKLNKRKIFQLFGMGGDNHHAHGLWETLTQYMPKIRLREGLRYLFREKSWITPTFAAQISAVIAAHYRAVNDADKLDIYEFLQAELLNISSPHDEEMVVHVRSVTTVEFMIFEAMRLKRQASIIDQQREK